MASYRNSMWKEILEAQERERVWNPTCHHDYANSSTYQGEYQYGDFAQEREMDWNSTGHHGYENSSTYHGGNQYEYDESYHSWNPTGHHGFESSSTYQGGIPYGHFAQENQYGYDESCHSWNMEYNHGEAYSSPISENEEIFNLLKLALEKQEELNKSLSMLSDDMRAWNQGSNSSAPTHEENAPINDEFLQEAEQILEDFELLLGCKVDDNLVIRYEDPCEDVVVIECLGNTKESSIVEDVLSTTEDMHVQPISMLEQEMKKPKEVKESHIEEAFKEDAESESPMAQPFHKHLGIISTKEVSIDDPWKIPFEEIRMNEFRGWFYDEYDPGDPEPCHNPL